MVSQISAYHSGSAYSRRLGDAQQIAGAGQHDENVVAPEHEPGQRAAEQPRLAGALHDVEGGGDQDIAAKGENHRRGVQRPQPPEIGPGQIGKIEQMRKGELQGDDDAHQHAGDAPEHGAPDAGLDDGVRIGRASRRPACGPTYIHMYQTPMSAMQAPKVQACITMRGSGERAASMRAAINPNRMVTGTR